MSSPRAVPFPLLALGVTGLLVGALWAGFAGWWPEGGTDALTTAAVIGLIAAWVGHRAGRAVRGRLPGPQAEVTAHLVGMGIRMMLTLGAALVVLVADRVSKVPFGVAISAIYLALLALEVFVTLRAVRQNPPQNAPAKAPQSDQDDA